MIRFETLGRDELAAGCSRCFPLGQMRRWLALANDNVYWVSPRVGVHPADVPPRTQFLLWEWAEGGYGAALPMLAGDMKASLRGCDDGVCVEAQGAMPGAEPETAELLCIAWGEDPYALCREAVEAVARRLGTFRLRGEKPEPAFMEELGWCTWDAFYGAVDEEKLIAGLESFRQAEFPLGFMILDDGAFDSRGDLLYEARISPTKFPAGLGGLIRRAKEDYGLRRFGIWHNFEGYWAGVCPDGPLAERYTLLHNRGNIRPWLAEPQMSDTYIIHPAQIGRFYDELHAYLRDAGVDMVKIDGQSAMDVMTSGLIGQGGAMRAYQQAMQAAAARCFDGQVIHCMCNSVDVAYHMMETNCWRNSDDYIPGSLRKQQEHLYINALNALWSSTFAVPDWDMFQSHAAGAEIHAAARAISGGPVYVSDHPGKQRFDILRRLVTAEGYLLRCDRPALPSPDCLFTDCRKEPALLKVFNRCGRAGVLGAFNCSEEAAASGELRVEDIPDLTGERFVVCLQPGDRVLTLQRGGSIPVEVAKDEYALAFFLPLEGEIVPIGLLDKYNVAAGVVSACWVEDTLRTELREAGMAGFWCARKPAGVCCGGAAVEYRYDADSGLLRVAATDTVVEIRL